MKPSHLDCAPVADKKKIVLYDTVDYDETCLTKFHPNMPRSYYKDRKEIYSNFLKAKVAVLLVLEKQLQELQYKIRETEEMTPETCPLGNDPY